MWKGTKISTAIFLAAAVCVTGAGSVAEAASKRIEGVPVYGQYPELPSGCEATAVSMIIRWAGSSATKVDVAKAMPRESLPYLQDGVLVGGDPFKGFVGDPFVEKGAFGVFAKPMVGVVNHFLPGKGVDLSGKSFDDLIATIDAGRPVAAWVTNYLQEPDNNANWTTFGGRAITWRSPEHVMTMVGYTDSQIIVNDAANGTVRYYDRDRFRYVWEKMGRQALTVSYQPQPQYSVYQYSKKLKDFVSYQDSLRYAKSWDHASVRDIDTGEVLWDNMASQVFQRNTYLGDYASQTAALDYAKEWDHAMVKDVESGEIVWSNWPLNVFLNGREQSYDQPPINDGGRVLVPFRGIVEGMGGQVSWDEATRTVTATKGEQRVVLPVGSQQAQVNGNSVQLDVPAKIVGGRTMIPVRFVSEALGADVKWEGVLSRVVITGN
jgi:uncharacterized protein YvpB